MVLGKLKNVLNALALAFPEIGYCQGSNFIVANILLFLDEECAFNVMFHLFYWQRHEMLMSNLSNIHCKVYVLDRNFPTIQI